MRAKGRCYGKAVTPTFGDGAYSRSVSATIESGRGGSVDKDEQELELEEEIFEEIAEHEVDEISLDASLRSEDEAPDEFVQGSIDAEDLTTGFNATIPTQEMDVDEDTQGDEVVKADVEEPMTELEVPDGTNVRVRGDEIELDLLDALTTGKTVAEAPEDD
jgi:hypothetical protein